MSSYKFSLGWDMLAHSGKFLAAHRGTTNIGITGSGIIDGGGKRECAHHSKEKTYVILSS